MKILHLTDIHLTTPGESISGCDPNANFEAALAHALSLHSDAALMVITGDLSDWGEQADYERLRARLADLPMPVGLCIGNHDDRATFLDVFPERADPLGFAQGVFDLPGARCLFLDTWGPETHAGHFCATRQAWLAARLDEHDGPFLIFLHHNPIPSHVAPMDSIMLLDHQAFGEVLRPRAERIRHIFHGHCHLPMAGSLHGIPVTSSRGTNHAGWPAFEEGELLTGADLPAAYAVAFVQPSAITVHMVEFAAAQTVQRGASPDYATWDKGMAR
ncbi:MAG: phosphodiesterase [Pseudomonadota bacterium]